MGTEGAHLPTASRSEATSIRQPGQERPQQGPGGTGQLRHLRDPGRCCPRGRTEGRKPQGTWDPETPLLGLLTGHSVSRASVCPFALPPDSPSIPPALAVAPRPLPDHQLGTRVPAHRRRCQPPAGCRACPGTCRVRRVGGRDVPVESGPFCFVLNMNGRRAAQGGP